MKHFSLMQALLHALCAVALLLLPSAALSAQEPAARSDLEVLHRTQTSQRYAQANWPQGAVRQGLPNQLGLSGWNAEPLQSAEGRITRGFRRVGEERAAPAFVIESWVADGVAPAQELMVDWLAGLQSDQRMPSLDELGLRLGDAGFAGPSGAGGSAFAWIAFVRGNVAVRVSATSARSAATVDLAEIARAVDEKILRAPLLEEGSSLPRPQIREFRALRSEAVAGESIELRLDLLDPAQGEPHLQWVIGGPGQGYVERDANGRWILHTTGPGALTLSVEATGSNGSFARASFALLLADD